jgi:hypothetical protein
VLAVAIAFVVGALLFGGIGALTGFTVGHVVGEHRGGDRGHHSREFQSPPYTPRKAPAPPGRPGKPAPAPSPTVTQ